MYDTAAAATTGETNSDFALSGEDWQECALAAYRGKLAAQDAERRRFPSD